MRATAPPLPNTTIPCSPVQCRGPAAGRVQACWRSLPELAAVQGGLPETHTLGALADWAARALAAYPTTIDADEEALRARGGQPGGRAAVAVQSRLERKRLLATAARTLTLLETAYAAAASTSA